MRRLSMVPFIFVPGGMSKDVPFSARVCSALFGAPNARRANGIISTKFDVAGALRRLAMRLGLQRERDIPVFAIDREGTPAQEGLPRIWLSERISNTSNSDGLRQFVETYPCGPDAGGVVALELGDRYFGEGMRASGKERTQCFQAAEILYLHSVRRGSRLAASRLRDIYKNDLCEGSTFKTYLCAHARHARANCARKAVESTGRMLEHRPFKGLSLSQGYTQAGCGQ